MSNEMSCEKKKLTLEQGANVIRKSIILYMEITGPAVQYSRLGLKVNRSELRSSFLLLTVRF